MADTPYSISLRRQLSPEERELLRYLVQRQDSHEEIEVESLYVVARCGCGRCPTVLLGQSLDSEPKTGKFKEIASYLGRNTEGALVAVALLERDGEIAELEAWSVEGVDITSWPLPSELRAIASDVTLKGPRKTYEILFGGLRPWFFWSIFITWQVGVLGDVLFCLGAPNKFNVMNAVALMAAAFLGTSVAYLALLVSPAVRGFALHKGANVSHVKKVAAVGCLLTGCSGIACLAYGFRAYLTLD